MIGVVLWSDQDDQKAVVWCEDHGDLAYLDTREKRQENPLLLNVGDMVEFKLSVVDKVRRGHDPKVLCQQACDGLPDKLRANAAKPQADTNVAKTMGELLAFTPRPANDAPVRHLRNG